MVPPANQFCVSRVKPFFYYKRNNRQREGLAVDEHITLLYRETFQCYNNTQIVVSFSKRFMHFVIEKRPDLILT